ncbi:MAG: apolipoprotein N-acyltransferase [Ectothiorhodospiraceae bacterium]|nr:apolipoprotein N-acyltransferase [Ectothiorhodospiraceae bacterium]
MPLAFAPLHQAWVAVISPAVLFAILARAPRRLGLWAAYWYGVGYFGAGGHWIYVSVGEFGGGPWVALVFCVVLALAFGLLIWCVARIWYGLRPGGDLPALVVALPACWLLVEWVRSWLFTGTTWIQLGYSQTDTWLSGLAPVVGALGLSLVLAVLAGLLAWTMLNPGRLSAGVFALAVVGSLLLGAVVARDWTEPAGEPVRIALLQGNVPQDEKWLPENREAIMARYERLTTRFWGADVIIWPETAVPAFYHQVVSDYLAPLAAEAENRGSDLLIGLPAWDRESNSVYNSVVSLGTEIDFYHKRHLVPFGEYVPFRNAFGGLLDVFGAPIADFTPGWRANTLRLGDQPMAVFICYEITFPGQVRDFLPEATVLVNVSNDAWFGGSVGPHQHFQKARMRALETGRPLVRSTNTGITAAVDPRGRVTARAPQFVVDALLVEVTPRKGTTPYIRWGDAPVLGLMSLMLLAAAGLRWTERRSA